VVAIRSPAPVVDGSPVLVTRLNLVALMLEHASPRKKNNENRLKKGTVVTDEKISSTSSAVQSSESLTFSLTDNYYVLKNRALKSAHR
jgi:hypothetical protein